MTSQLLFKQAVDHHRQGNLAEAGRFYAQVLDADPKNFPAQYQLAFLLYQQQRPDAALAAAEAALKLNRHSSEARLLQSVLLLHGGRLDEALSSISMVTTRDAGNVEAWQTRGLILSGLRRFEEALSAFDKALAVKPAHAGALCHRGDALMELKRYPEAVAAFERALVQAPDLFEAWSNRGLALFEMERFAESLESYEKAVAVRPDSAPAWANRGKALDRLERFDDALTSYDKAIALAPHNAETWYARTLVLRTMHRLEDALESIDKALAIEPASPPFHFMRGWLLCELNRISDGLRVIRQTAEDVLRPKDGVPASAHQQRHDAEQKAYLAGQGVQFKDGDVHLAGGDRLRGAAVNPANAESGTAQWQKNRPRIAVIDNFLSDQALDELRRFCWDSTLWRTSYEAGYLGAAPEKGFACPLLAQIAEELRDTFPSIVGDHRLRRLWGFKYDSRLRGIGIHADQAAVNVNFWITPDGANQNPQTGGMVIWDVAAPPDWTVRKYNADEPAVRDFLAQTGAKPVTVPYRANRAVIFDSDLFHETDAIDFKEGYLNRRINLTILYGRRTYYGR
jgi:tetratricopeptide (TPR) repeat protein